MDFAELLAVVAVFVGMPWAVLSGIAKVKAARAAEQGGVRASELEAIVRRRLADASEPLRRRIETLEAIATDGEPGRLDAAALADALGADSFGTDAREETTGPRRRVRA